MLNIQRIFIIFITVLSLLWLAANPVDLSEASFFGIRHAMMNYTGILAIAMMSIGMILAMRWSPIDAIAGGLDKSYRLHKWLGIGGLVLSVTHYLWANVPKWMVGLGLLERPQRHRPTEETDAITAFFNSQHGIAESIGEWTFYAVVILLTIALVKKIPYRLFNKIHRLIAPAYLLLAYHSIILMDMSFWLQPVGIVMAVLVAGGSYAALISLFKRIGRNRRTSATIEKINYLAESKVLKLDLLVDRSWSGHKAGQFAFLTFDKSEGAHPFSISSSWKNDGRLTFMIKGLGDYTSQLPQLLNRGDSVSVEGPYGEFNFSSATKHQIWIAGGIGIAPFLSKIQQLKHSDQAKEIDLFYSTDTNDIKLIEELEQNAEQAGIRFHPIMPDIDGRLDTHTICKKVPEWKLSEIWFCGPGAFGHSIRRGFERLGLSSENYHQELFEVR